MRKTCNTDGETRHATPLLKMQKPAETDETLRVIYYLCHGHVETKDGG